MLGRFRSGFTCPESTAAAQTLPPTQMQQAFSTKWRGQNTRPWSLPDPYDAVSARSPRRCYLHGDARCASLALPRTIRERFARSFTLLKHARVSYPKGLHRSTFGSEKRNRHTTTHARTKSVAQRVSIRTRCGCEGAGCSRLQHRLRAHSIVAASFDEGGVQAIKQGSDGWRKQVADGIQGCFFPCAFLLAFSTTTFHLLGPEC